MGRKVDERYHNRNKAKYMENQYKALDYRQQPADHRVDKYRHSYHGPA